MKATSPLSADWGVPCRVWPFARGNHAVLSVAAGRPHHRKKCEILVSRDGSFWETAGEFFTGDERQSTTGQPFMTSRGTVLVPVWDVDFYTHGRTYFCIRRRGPEQRGFEKVYEDTDGTYANHFLETAGGAAVFIGVGVEGGGAEGKVGFTPGSGYILRSMDDGRTFERVLRYNKPCSLYQGVQTRNGSVLWSTRGQKSLIDLETGTETLLDDATRCVAFVEALDTFVVTSNSAIFLSPDAACWRKVPFPLPGYALRYPTLVGGRLLFTAVGWRSLLVAYGYEGGTWFLVKELTGVTRSTFARMALFKDVVLCGSEFDGKLLKLPVRDLAEGGKRIGRISGFVDKIMSRVHRSITRRSRMLLHPETTG